MTDSPLHDSAAAAAADNGVEQLLCRPRPARKTLLFIGGMALAATLLALARQPAVADTSKDKESTSVRYAKAYLQLAEAQLAIAKNLNEQSPGTFSSAQMEERRSHVELCKQELAATQQGKDFDRMKWVLQLVSFRAADAQQRLAASALANRRAPGAVAADKLDALRAHETIAQIDEETGQAALGATKEVQLQWRVSVLEDELLRLREEVSLLRKAYQ